MIGGGGAGSSKQSPPREGFLHCAGRQHQPQTLCSAKAGAPAISLLQVGAVAGPCPPSAGFSFMGLQTLKPRLSTLKTDKVKVLEPKAGATQMERGRAWMSKRERVAQRFGYRCAECGLVLMPGKWECDHIVPREQGGSNDEANLQSLCVPCHQAKTAREAKARAKGDDSVLHRSEACMGAVHTKPLASKNTIHGEGLSAP